MVKNGEKYLAMPWIASGLDGGDWSQIKALIKDIFSESDIEIEVRYLK
ncbi:MAG: hypothetical protein ACFFAS_15945 [Promethearchaeota archaeon]